MTFEEANKELDKILEKLESGETGLEEGTELFERATELSQFCYKEFNKAKGKISVLKETLGVMLEEKF